jgi:hypothetical protein
MDKNESIASTLMFLSNQTNATTETLPKNQVHCGATNPLAWPSPCRVVPTNHWCATATWPPNKVATQGGGNQSRDGYQPAPSKQTITGRIVQEWENETQGGGGGMRNQGKGRGGTLNLNSLLEPFYVTYVSSRYIESCVAT